MEIPFWYQLLDFWVNKQKNSGLSFPFIIGAGETYVGQKAPAGQEIFSLLEDISNTIIMEFCVTLFYCQNVEAYLLGLQPKEQVQEPFFTSDSGEPTLAVIDKVFLIQDSLMDIALFLKGLYQSYIELGKFSRTPTAFGQWGAFSLEDDLQIKRSLTRYTK